MTLFTKEIFKTLLKNGKMSQERGLEDKLFDPYPVVKLFLPEGGATWLLSEIDPDDPDIAFGLCDLGAGFPELGTVRISELQELRGGLFRLPVERDRWFEAHSPLSWYANIARQEGSIIFHAHTNVELDIAS